MQQPGTVREESRRTLSGVLTDPVVGQKTYSSSPSGVGTRGSFVDAVFRA